MKGVYSTMAKHCEYEQQLRHLKVTLDEMQDIIDKHRTIKEWAYIIHNKDVKSDGTPIEPHIHLYLNFGESGASFKTVAKWFKDDEERISKVKGRKGDVLMYLTHQNAPDKFQYSEKEVKSNFDVNKAIVEDRKLHSLVMETEQIVFDFMQEIITYAQANKRLNDLKKVCNKRELLKAILNADKTIEQIWKYQCKMSVKGTRNMQIIFIHGDSGSGKSTYAELYAKMLCDKKGYRDFARSSASNDIMQDYMGEDILILDDYRDVDEMTGKSENLTDTLKMLDPHYITVARADIRTKPLQANL